MQAIILAAGMGSRFGSLTAKRPKCLLEIGGQPILGRILTSLAQYGVNSIIITVGYREQQIRQYVEKYFPKLRVHYVRNPKFRNTNYIYSLWLACSYINADVVLMHADLLYDETLLKRAIHTPMSCVLVRRGTRVPRKDFKAKIVQGRVHEIGVRVSGKDARFCLPIYKFLTQDWRQLMRTVEHFVQEGRLQCYMEDALNTVLSRIPLFPVYFGRELGMEIDTRADLTRAKALVDRVPEGTINL